MKLKSTGEIITDYAQYHSTRHWANIKKRLKGKRCWWCKKRIHADHLRIGHHRTNTSYKRLGRERLGFPFYDVVLCCGGCHDGKSVAHRKMHKNIKPPIIQKTTRKRKKKMIKRLIVMALIIGAFIGGVLVARWTPAEKILDKIGLSITKVMNG